MIENPVRTDEDLKKLRAIKTNEDLPYLIEAIQKTRKQLSPKIPLIGFCGAPFTVASYMIEGKSSKNFIATKTLMKNSPFWKSLMN